jgi:hypothetical protein
VPLPRPARCGGQAIDRLKAGGLAGFVTSHHTMDKADNRARAQIASMADLVGAIRLPEGSFRAAVGTEVGVDLLFFRKLRTGKWQDQSDQRSFRKLPSACLVHSCATSVPARSRPLSCCLEARRSAAFDAQQETHAPSRCSSCA